MIYPKHGESVSAIDHFWGECSSKVIFLVGVEIKLVDFGGSVVPFQENLGGGRVGLCGSRRFCRVVPGRESKVDVSNV